MPLTLDLTLAEEADPMLALFARWAGEDWRAVVKEC